MFKPRAGVAVSLKTYLFSFEHPCTIFFLAPASDARACLGTAGRCVTCMWISVKPHLASMMVCVSTGPGVLCVCACLDTQVCSLLTLKVMTNQY